MRLNSSTILQFHNIRRLKELPLYKCWDSIIQRCTNPNSHNYRLYGGRGISICAQWRHDFQAFYDHVTKLPDFQTKGYSLDRIDTNGNYEPSNVRWATKTEQSRNRRVGRYIRLVTFDDKTQSISAWAEETKIPVAILLRRLGMGWPIEKVLGAYTRRRRSISRWGE